MLNAIATTVGNYSANAKFRKPKRSCSNCKSTNVRVERFDCGTERETGYSDSGQVLICLDCGEAVAL